MSVFGWDLPPGVSHKDIDDHFGSPRMIECSKCDGQGKIPDEEVPEEIVQCSRCNGEGEIIDEEVKKIDDDDDDYDNNYD